MTPSSAVSRWLRHAISFGTSRPAVSVVIPFYGKRREIRVAIQALECQSFTNFEVVVVADGCSFKAVEMKVLRQSGIAVQVIRLSENCGAFAARIVGAAHARGDYLWFLDHDDYVESGFLGQMYTRAVDTKADIVECPFLVCEPNRAPRLFSRFNGQLERHGKDIFEAYLRGESHNNLANKLIRRRCWSKAINSLEKLGISQKQRLNFCEDMLCTIILYDLIEHYASENEVHYGYCRRSGSTTNIGNREAVEACISDLAMILSTLRPLLLQYSHSEALVAFQVREVDWILTNMLLRRVGNCLSPEAWNEVGRIQTMLK
ncbi:glycosyltransferase family 2 protein [Cyanobium sp. ATX 6A2]|uniref:glycosyltransferase family 2 protein n=1 Tax=Cyanobium sp. ATX 6A2 TaxID=2823700 RepID=UPI0020CC886C|nr:glycosyltransferase family 2 protein [Cyanobium sp. ATX 6A2]MCP9889431.1 glycosyltransferase family 2 protein [Cyanobium sp. ATX 6A2]